MSNLKKYYEEEWFNEFYPNEWGDWKQNYNIAAYQKDCDETGCSWEHYSSVGFLSAAVNGLMKVESWHGNNKRIVEHIFLECIDCEFIQPIYQKKDDAYYCEIELTKEDSNLDLYLLRVCGCDDCSYSKHIIGLDGCIKELERLDKDGINNITDFDYFFSN